MDLRIGVTQSPREMTLELEDDTDREELQRQINDALVANDELVVRVTKVRVHRRQERVVGKRDRAVAAAGDDGRRRWDGQDLRAFTGTYGDYLLGKVSKVFPQLRRDVLE